MRSLNSRRVGRASWSVCFQYKAGQDRWPAIVSLLIVSFSACNPAPHYSRPTMPAPPSYKEAPPDQYKEVAGWKIAEPGDDKIRAKWWEMYHDPNLNQLEEQVEVSNQTIAVAEANFRAARATVVAARSAFSPP